MSFNYKKMKKERKRIGYTQFELSEKCEVTQAYISLVERGKKNPRKPVVALIEIALKLKEGSLIKGKKL